MTREEFMTVAEGEIAAIMASQKNRLMNIISRAWAEGKRNAESEELAKIVKDAIDRITPSPTIVSPTWPPITYNDPVPLPYKPVITCEES